MHYPLSMEKMSTTEVRFRDGTGTRYMNDGVTVRCQAVSKTKLRRIRVERGLDPDDKSISPDDVWPEAQCERPAVQGKLLCAGRGGHGGGSLSVPTHNYLDFMPVDLREKMQLLIENPQILSRRMEIMQLMARILVLYERMQTNESLGVFSLSHLQEGLEDIENGDLVAGVAKIKATLDSRLVEAESYSEVRQTMALLKDMTKVEIGSIKEMKQVIPFDVLISVVQGIADSLQEAVDANVGDERTKRLIVGAVERTISRRLNTRLPRILPETEEETVEADFVESE
jgi:hypothetical protein